MKVLKDETEYIYNDFMELKCNVCKKILWDTGKQIVKNSKIRCPQCSTTYTFEPTRWRVLSESPE
jgi:DNA-directed RNA polymerase subunit RPC12/RpoP